MTSRACSGRFIDECLSLCSVAGKYDEALKWYQEALTTVTKHYGPEHPEVRERIGRAGVIEKERGREGEREETSCRARTQARTNTHAHTRVRMPVRTDTTR